MADLKPHTTDLPYADLWSSPDNDLQVPAWRAAEGKEWGDRNPDDAHGTNVSWFERFRVHKTDAIKDALWGIPTDSTWLEIGCSAGAHMRVFTEVGWGRIQGCDVNLPSVRRAPGSPVCADARHLPYADRSFDGITTSGSLMHFGPEARLKDCLLEMERVARRWMLLCELWNPEPMLVSFGDLMPPAWVYPWDRVLSHILGDRWGLVRHRLYRTTHERYRPIAFYLLQRR